MMMLMMTHECASCRASSKSICIHSPGLSKSPLYGLDVDNLRVFDRSYKFLTNRISLDTKECIHTLCDPEESLKTNLAFQQNLNELIVTLSSMALENDELVCRLTCTDGTRCPKFHGKSPFQNFGIVCVYCKNF